MRILILGGYGTFGGRLVRLLADEPHLTLIVAGRSEAKARTFIGNITAQTTLVPAAVDRNGDLVQALSLLKPDMIVDASGPFQTYGDDPYQVIETAIESGISYLDLADGAEFVSRIARYDAQAKQRGVFVLSGVSTFPALSCAVVRRLTKGWQRVLRVECALAPSPRAGLGGSVVRAIMAYAGQQIPLIRSGKPAQATALVDACRRTIAPPGVTPLPPMRYVLVEVPDLRLMAEEHAGLRDIWVGVGTRPQILLRGLSLCARAVQAGLIMSLTPLAGTAEWFMRYCRWGEHRGGLLITASGIDATGEACTRHWHMIAEEDDGPFIPSMAAEALIRNALDGKIPAPGARAATQEIELDAYEAAFAKRQITCGVRGKPNGTLYQQILGPAWKQLPTPIQKMHEASGPSLASGIATVERGRNPFARLIGLVVGFPKAGTEVPVEVRFTPMDEGELWERSFAGKRFSSFQKPGTGQFTGLLSERFGPLEFGLALVVQDEKLKLVTRGWRAFGIPMPRFLAPGGDSFEHVENGVFHFNVEISHPLSGLIVRYRGCLEPQTEESL